MRCCSAFIINVIIIGIFWCNIGVIGRQSTYYQNQFAVHIPTSQQDADEIAAKHGFDNIGKVGFFKSLLKFPHRPRNFAFQDQFWLSRIAASFKFS